LTKKSFFYIHLPLKKFVLLLQLLKIFNFCLTFRWRRERTTNELFRWRNFSPAAAKYVSGKRALGTFSGPKAKIHTCSWWFKSKVLQGKTWSLCIEGKSRKIVRKIARGGNYRARPVCRLGSVNRTNREGW
jgi:hypothetical protein